MEAVNLTQHGFIEFPKLEAQLQKILSIPETETLQNVITQLGKTLRDDGELRAQLTEIEILEKNVAGVEQKYQNVVEQLDKLIGELPQALVTFEEFTEAAEASYDYMEYGCGHFEEYEINISDLNAGLIDPEYIKAARIFGKRLGERDVVEAINTYGYSNGLKGINEEHTCFGVAVTSLFNFMIGIDLSQFDREDFTQKEELLENVEMAYDTFEGEIDDGIQAIEGALENEYPEYPDDPYNPSKIQSLESALEVFLEMRLAAATHLQKCSGIFSAFEEYQRLFNQIDFLEKERAQLERQLKQELKKMKKIVKKRKAVVLSESLQSRGGIVAVTDQQVELYQKLHLLIKRHLYAINVTEANPQKLFKMEEEARAEILKAKEANRRFDAYILFKRIERKLEPIIQELHDIGSRYLDVVGTPKTFEGREIVFWKGKDKDIVYSCESKRKHPLDSPLVSMLDGLAGRKISKGQLSGFLALTGPHTEFERGAYRMIKGNALEGTVCSQKIYAQLPSTEIAGRGITPMSSQRQRLPVVFDLSGLPFTSSGIKQLTPEMVELFSHLTVRLSFELDRKGVRKALKIPQGHPIVALLVSNER